MSVDFIRQLFNSAQNMSKIEKSKKVQSFLINVFDNNMNMFASGVLEQMASNDHRSDRCLRNVTYVMFLTFSSHTSAGSLAAAEIQTATVCGTC